MGEEAMTSAWSRSSEWRNSDEKNGGGIYRRRLVLFTMFCFKNFHLELPWSRAALRPWRRRWLRENGIPKIPPSSMQY